MAAVTALQWLLVTGALWQMHTQSHFEPARKKKEKKLHGTGVPNTHTHICALTLIHRHTQRLSFWEMRCNDFWEAVRRWLSDQPVVSASASAPEQISNRPRLYFWFPFLPCSFAFLYLKCPHSGHFLIFYAPSRTAVGQLCMIDYPKTLMALLNTAYLSLCLQPAAYADMFLHFPHIMKGRINSFGGPSCYRVHFLQSRTIKTSQILTSIRGQRCCFKWNTNDRSFSINPTQTMIAIAYFLLAEHCGGGEVHPGSDELDAGPERLLQPVPGDGLRQTQRVQGHLQHGLQVQGGGDQFMRGVQILCNWEILTSSGLKISLINNQNPKRPIRPNQIKIILIQLGLRMLRHPFSLFNVHACFIFPELQSSRGVNVSET